MDVTCDRCGTEYEFEEALVSTRGTTVKCTHCGHLFKVYKPEAPAEPSAAKNPWTVRRADGSIHRLHSLADLTRLIEEGAFGREDELSRTSKAWKRIGDIEELDVFFARANSPRVRPRRATGAPQLGTRKAPPAPPSEPAARGGDTVVGRLTPAAPAPTLGSNPAPSATTPGVAPAPVPPSTPPPSAASAIPAPSVAPGENGSSPRKLPVDRASGRGSPQAGLPAATPPPPPIVNSPERVPSSDPAGESGESEPTTVHNPVAQLRESLPDAYDPFARPKSTGWVWALVIIATVLAFGTWLTWPMFENRHPANASKQDDPAIEFLARADSAFATHREQRFEEALTDYTKALAFHENDPHVLSSISRVWGVWSQELATRAELLAKETGASPDLERRSQLLALNKQARDFAEQAKRYAENAARKNPGNEEAEVALADALRLTGNLVSARSELDRAQNNESSPSGETLRVAALLAIAEANGDLRKGLPFASQAVAQDPELIRARLLLARCLIADGDLTAARFQLAAVSTKDRSHPGVLALEQLAQTQSVGDTQLKVDAGTAKESVGDSPVASSRNDKDKDGDKDKDKDKDEGNFDNLSHEAYIARGQKMLESGQVTNAKRMFEQALFIRPSSAEAHLGLGYVALEKGRTRLAVEHFQEAKKDGNAEALIGLGEAYRRMNRPREALRAYQSYVADHARGPQIGIAKAQVERLTEEAGAGKK
jgi:predicted Zn finger-like uncharacterized protein